MLIISLIVRVSKWKKYRIESEKETYEQNKHTFCATKPVTLIKEKRGGIFDERLSAQERSQFEEQGYSYDLVMNY